MIEELKKFTYNVYNKFLRLLKDHYQIIPLSEAPEADQPYLVLRHDVDGSLKAALKLAEIEKDLGIKATYFVLFSSQLYNPFEKEGLAILKQISKLGHEIGLHYDLAVLDQSLLEQEIDLLEHILNRSVKCIARHRQSEKRPKIYLYSGGRIGAEDTTLYDLHISDSVRIWEEDKLRALLSFQYGRVQVSLHPFLWTEFEMDRLSCLKRLFNGVHARNEKTHMKWRYIWITEGAASKAER